MAKGRFLSKTVGHSREIAALPDDTSRMIFAFILPHLDSDGRIDADPIYLGGVCLSRLRIAPAVVAKALVAMPMHEVGLIELYEEEGLPFLQYLNFEKHQAGLRKEREAPSPYPAPTGRFPTEFDHLLKTKPYQTPPTPEPSVGDELRELEQEPRSNSGVTPEDSGLSLSTSLSESPSPSKSRSRSAQTPQSAELVRSPQPPTPATASEERLKNFALIKAKLGPKRKTTPDEEDIDLITECLTEDASRDRWFDLPHARVQQAIRDATARFRKGGQFKSEFIAELDKASGPLRASVSPATETFDETCPRMGVGDR